jgi:hypothetical protein
VAIPQQPRAESPTAAASVDMDRPAPSLDLDRAVSFHVDASGHIADELYFGMPT